MIKVNGNADSLTIVIIKLQIGLEITFSNLKHFNIIVLTKISHNDVLFLLCYDNICLA